MPKYFGIFLEICQSNLAISGIAANWEFRFPKSLLPVGAGPLFSTILPGTTRVSLPNGISFRPTTLARCTSVADDKHTYIHTDGRTDHATVTSVAIGRLAESPSAMSPEREGDG